MSQTPSPSNSSGQPGPSQPNPPVIRAFDFTKAVFVTTEVKMWSGRATITKDDLDPVILRQLPPEALATLGSRKLIDPERLKPIAQVKNDMMSYLKTCGIRFLGGYIVEESRLLPILRNLQGYADEFNAAVATFLSSYEAATDLWVKSFPLWEELIRRALPTEDVLRGKYSCTFQAMRIVDATPQVITPTSEALSSGDGADALLTSAELPSNDLARRIGSLATTCLSEIQEGIRSILDTSFTEERIFSMDKSAAKDRRIKQRTMEQFTPIVRKLRETSLFSPDLETLADYVDGAVSLCTITDATTASQVRAFVNSMRVVLSSPESIVTSFDKRQAPAPEQQPEPTQPEPTQPEPTQPEPTQPEPTQPEPTQPEPTGPVGSTVDDIYHALGAIL